MYGLGRQAFLFEIKQNKTDGSEYHVLYCVFCCNSKSVFSGMHTFLFCYIWWCITKCVRIVLEIAKKIEFNFQTSKAIYQGKDLKKHRWKCLTNV